jgi:hypothetical protein
MEKKHDEKGISRRTFIKGLSMIAVEASVPFFAHAFGSSLVVNKTPIWVPQMRPGHLEKYFDMYNVFVAEKGSLSYIVADVKDPQFKINGNSFVGSDIRAYVEGGRPITFSELEARKKEFRVSDMVLDYQVHANNGFVRNIMDVPLAFLYEFKSPYCRDKRDLDEKVIVSPKFSVDGFSRAFDRECGREVIQRDKFLALGFGYYLQWGPDFGVNGGGNGGSPGGGVGGSGGVGGAAGG